MQAQRDKGTSCLLKKRLRKDLSVDEIEAIVAATREPFTHQKDVAQRFRVTSALVGRLVREIEKKPEVVEELRNCVKLVQEKKDAIESAVTKMLKTNKPIVRI